jgi:hypothetical protein
VFVAIVLDLLDHRLRADQVADADAGQTVLENDDA